MLNDPIVALDHPSHWVNKKTGSIAFFQGVSIAGTTLMVSYLQDDFSHVCAEHQFRSEYAPGAPKEPEQWYFVKVKQYHDGKTDWRCIEADLTKSEASDLMLKTALRYQRNGWSYHEDDIMNDDAPAIDGRRFVHRSAPLCSMQCCRDKKDVVEITYEIQD